MAKSVVRPYYLRHKTTGEERLVEAGTVAHAIRHVNSEWEASAATSRQAHELAVKGVKMETAVKESPEPAAA